MDDTVQHTLTECSAWELLRRELREVIGGDLSLLTVITKMVGCEEAWRAVASCESVMTQKKAAEKVRRRDVQPPATKTPRRKRRRQARLLSRRLLHPGGDEES